MNSLLSPAQSVVRAAAQLSIRQRQKSLLLLLLGSVMFSHAALAELSITQVTRDKSTLSQHGETIAISFQLSEPAQVTVRIYNPFNELVRTLGKEQSRAAGQQIVSWDGLDDQGVAVPPDAYVYTLSARNSNEAVLHDLTDITGGEIVSITDITYEPEKNEVTYVVEKPGRVYLRVGIENGFVLKTLLNNEVQTAGTHTLVWDGSDQSQVLSLRDHPKLRFYGSGYRFSENTIIVQWLATRDHTALENRTSRLPKRNAKPRPPGLDRHAYHPVERCRDVTLSLELPNTASTDADGIPIVESGAAWRVGVHPQDQLLMESERSEIVFFLDNQLLYENETSYFPYTWNWSPKVLMSGVHYMTAFVVGFNEHFGFTTRKFKLSQGGHDASGSSGNSNEE